MLSLQEEKLISSFHYQFRFFLFLIANFTIIAIFAPPLNCYSSFDEFQLPNYHSSYKPAYLTPTFIFRSLFFPWNFFLSFSFLVWYWSSLEAHYFYSFYHFFLNYWKPVQYHYFTIIFLFSTFPSFFTSLFLFIFTSFFASIINAVIFLNLLHVFFCLEYLSIFFY